MFQSIFSLDDAYAFVRAIQSSRLFIIGSMMVASETMASTGQMAVSTAEGIGWWEIAAVVFVVGMLLSIFHSISLLKHSSKPGPEYWLNRMAHACSKGDPKAAEQALLLWAKTVWGNEAPGSLLEIANRLEREEMAQLIRQMREASRNEPSEWNSYLCAQVLVDYLRQVAEDQKGAE